MNHTGKKTNVYGGWRPTSLLHEVLLTEEILPFLTFPHLRGNRVDQRLRPDATVFFPTPIHFEMDMDTEGYPQVEEQIDRYQNEFNVWIVPTETRMRGIMRIAGPSTMVTVLGSGVWFDQHGEKLLVEEVLSLFPTRTA